VAVIVQLKSGSWRVQVRRKGQYASKTFLRKSDADDWAIQAARDIDNGKKPSRRVRNEGVRTFGHLIDLHLNDMREVGRPLRRSKDHVLRRLKEVIGDTPLTELSKAELIAFGRRRAKDGAGPATLAIDISFIGTVMTHAAAVHDVEVDPEQLRLARYALRRLGLVAKAKERDRRPTAEELRRILQYLDTAPRVEIPMGRIVRFAIATAMRSEEIHKIRWDDLDPHRKTALIRDRKDPRKKDGNDQFVPLVNFTGFDAWALLEEQREWTRPKERCFPYNHKSSEAAFRRCVQALKIEDLRFHDLRHDGTSRLFEAGLQIEQVALITGHKDWKQLKRYTNLRPEQLHALPNKPLVVEAPVKPGREWTSAPALPANVVLLHTRKVFDAPPS
jgi:integrase